MGRLSLGTVVWLVFFEHISTIGGVLSALLAVLLWPLVLLGIRIVIAI